MSSAPTKSTDKVKAYFNKKGSRIGYKLVLGGTKHFGYYPPGYESLSMQEAMHKMEDLLAAKLQLKKGLQVFDGGCGEGRVATYLAKKYGVKVAGMDLLDWAVHSARKFAKRNGVEDMVSFEVGDYSKKLPFPSESFDAAYTMETLVHVKNFQGALAEFYRVLKPGGRVAFFEYTRSPDEKLSQKAKESLDLITREGAMLALPHFEYGMFEKYLAEAGFEQIKNENLTERVLPMLKRFRQLAYVPYHLLKWLGQREKSVNSVFAVEWYQFRNNDVCRYTVMSAVKPLV